MNHCERQPKKKATFESALLWSCSDQFYVADYDAFRWPEEAIAVAKMCNDIVVANGTVKVTDPRTSLPAHFVTLLFLN
eukprot:10751857-Ditylum_brightwellii.AAC.1